MVTLLLVRVAVRQTVPAKKARLSALQKEMQMVPKLVHPMVRRKVRRRERRMVRRKAMPGERPDFRMGWQRWVLGRRKARVCLVGVHC